MFQIPFDNYCPSFATHKLSPISCIFQHMSVTSFKYLKKYGHLDWGVQGSCSHVGTFNKKMLVCTSPCASRGITLHNDASTHHMCISSHQDNDVVNTTEPSKRGFPGKQVLGWRVYQCQFCDAANVDFVIIHNNIWQNLGINYKLNMKLKGSQIW
jgi:hypothetical protein